MFTSCGTKEAKNQRTDGHPPFSLSSVSVSESSLLLMRISVLHLGPSALAPDMPSVTIRNLSDRKINYPMHFIFHPSLVRKSGLV